MTANDRWASFTFDRSTTVTAKPHSPSVGEESKGSCLLLRGQENWLARVWKEEQKEMTQEILDDLRQEVRALFSQWLKMQNLCVLLGAGASKYVTGFVSSGLYEQVQRILAKRSSGETLKKLTSLTDKPLELGQRFEDFLSQLSSSTRLLKRDSGPLNHLTKGWSVEGLGLGTDAGEELSKLLLDIERAIAVACNVKLPESALTLQATSVTPHETFLAKLVSRDPQQGRARLFTTNYDTLLEQAMDRLGIVYVDGFVGTVARHFSPASYDIDLYYPGEVTAGRVRRYDKVLHLYKIHGSINWRRSIPEAGDPFGVVMDMSPLPSDAEVISRPELLDQIFTNSESDNVRQGLAILPTAAKFGESVTMPYAHLFRGMAQVMREPQTACFVIGYSGWDLHINRIIEDALTNPGFTCVIINQTLTDWGRRLVSSDYCGRVYVFAGDWATFEFLAQEMLPDLEILKTDLAIAKTLRDLQKARQSERQDQPKG